MKVWDRSIYKIDSHGKKIKENIPEHRSHGLRIQMREHTDEESWQARPDPKLLNNNIRTYKTNTLT